MKGSPTDDFKFERGLHHRDPISPFLYLLAAEGINVLMNAPMEDELFIEYSSCGSNNIYVSHFRFDDDTILLGVKSWANVRSLKVVFILFELISDLKVNFNKSMLFGFNAVESWMV